MSLFILDTNTLTLFDRNNSIVHQAVRTARGAGHTIALTAVTVEEQINGWFKLFHRAKDHARLARASANFSRAVQLWGTFPILPQTEASLQRFDALVAMKLNVGRMDLRIAAIALELAATLVTQNARDFSRVPALLLTDWTSPPPPSTPPPATH